MTVKEFNKALRGEPVSNMHILIKLANDDGSTTHVDCTIDEIVGDEQGGDWFDAVILYPNYDQLEN